jgi:two-component system sensor histidine kinase MtrB
MFPNPIKLLKRSLATRVVATTVTLFTVTVFLLGTAIFNEIEKRILDEKIDASITEAAIAIESAEFRFNVTPKASLEFITKAASDVLQLDGATGALLSGREIALLKSPKNKLKDINLEGISNFVDEKSVPQSLREIVSTSQEFEWALTQISYGSGKTLPGVAVGKLINVPIAGPYEMFLLFSFESQQASIDIIARGFIIIFAIVFLLILGMAYLVVRQVVEPIKAIAQVADSFTEGNFSERVIVKGEDEIAALGTAFNEMAFSIEQQISRLENLSRMQQRFVSDVSHELRNPLTTIRIASEVILGIKDQLDPAVARSAELLMSQIIKFDQLLSDLLEVSRFDAAVAVLESEPIDLVDLTVRAISALNGENSNIILKITPEKAQVLIDGDVRRIERILRNLISNALDHGEGKEILITIDVFETSVRIGLRDFGLGLSAEDLNHLFERFWRADPSRSRERGGTGLGLAIALEDAKLHGGVIQAYGEIGHGALFTLTLPIKSGQPITDSTDELTTQFRRLG